MEEKRGRIEMEYRVICGRCGFWEYMDGGNKRAMKKFAKEEGWVESEAWGWLCPNCIRELLLREMGEEDKETP